MSKITVLPHAELCPDGAVLEVQEGASLCETLIDNNIAIEHACEMSCACTTCHVIVREGYNSLNGLSEDEEDLLDTAWGLEATSRLSCQVKVSKENMVIEIPRYTINHARENH